LLIGEKASFWCCAKFVEPLTGVQHISVSMATKCLHKILLKKDFFFKKKKKTKEKKTKHKPKAYFLVNKSSHWF